MRGLCSTSATTTAPAGAGQTGQGLQRLHWNGPVHRGRLRRQSVGLPQRGRPGLRFYDVRHCRIEAPIGCFRSTIADLDHALWRASASHI
eukprot:3378351-Pyramimonas_sp.AAC.1